MKIPDVIAHFSGSPSNPTNEDDGILALRLRPAVRSFKLGG